jgi:AP-1 complex subunit beta-1
VSRLPHFRALLGLKSRICSLADSAKTALQTVAAGQAVENLLDFDDEPAPEGPTGLAATQVLQQPEAKNILSGTSTNPLDDLVSIFGNTSLSPSAPIPSAAPAAPAPATDPFGALGGVSLPTAAPSTTSNQQEDLLGLF